MDAIKLKSELSLQRAEEAEALRRANHLREMGASMAEVNAAVVDADRFRAQVNELHRKLRNASPQR